MWRWWWWRENNRKEEEEEKQWKCGDGGGEKTIEMWRLLWWWWRENNRNVAVVVVEGKQ